MLKRRRLLQAAATTAALAALPPTLRAAAPPATFQRVRPGDPDWPAPQHWARLDRAVGGRLTKLAAPLEPCRAAPAGAACNEFFAALKNPYYLGDTVGLTQALGWVDAWTSMPSAYAVAAQTTADVVAAVDFAREHGLRLVVKGGGHSYQGTSNAADSLLIWTRAMNTITLHDAFVAQGCAASVPQRAVSVGAGALWAHVYDAVTTQAGGYVQGGGCMTVGVAGLIQSGGFGSFSKAYGLAAAGLLEAEVVTADGAVRIANACTNAELFWGLKGGGGGSLGVLTRLTLKVHELPQTFGAVTLTIRATSDAAFRRLIGIVIDFCHRSLLNPHWGEQIRMADNVLRIRMVFQGLTRSEAKVVWQPFLDTVDGASQDYHVEFSPLKIVSTSAREFWAATPLKRLLGFISRDDRPGAPANNVYWPGDQSDAGQVLHGYGSAWLPRAWLLDDAQRSMLCDTLFAASRHWGFSLHLNKGLAGAPADAVNAARDTAMNPAVLDAFALLICGAGGPPAYPGIAGREPDVAAARRRAQAIARAMNELRKLVPSPGSYVSESDYFEADWQQSFWGSNYPRLLALKQQVDPDGLFFVYHGVGSERWSADGFSRIA